MLAGAASVQAIFALLSVCANFCWAVSRNGLRANMLIHTYVRMYVVVNIAYYAKRQSSEQAHNCQTRISRSLVVVAKNGSKRRKNKII